VQCFLFSQHWEDVDEKQLKKRSYVKELVWERSVLVFRRTQELEKKKHPKEWAKAEEGSSARRKDYLQRFKR